MRRWLCIGIAYVILGGVGFGWYFLGGKFTSEQLVRQGSSPPIVTRSVLPSPTQEGDGEASDAIEPLVVESSTPAQLQPIEWSVQEEGPLSRVVLVRGMQQPPRPDAEPCKRMPYADECEIRETPVDLLMRIVRSHLAQWNLFVEHSPSYPEDTEIQDVTPTPEPVQPMLEPMPIPDYHHHHQYCPGMGGCPYPYRR